MGEDATTDSPASRPQHLIVTIFGRYGRARGGSIDIAHLIEMMAVLGVDAGAVRSAVSRLKQRGVLMSDRSEGAAAYRLSERLEGVFAAGDRRIFEVHRAELGDPWLLASFSVPERERPLRHQLRKLLLRLGFGQVSGGLWIAPALIADETRTDLKQEGLSGYVELFTGARVSDEPLADAVRRWWDLPAMEARYRTFIDGHRRALDGPLDDADAFAAYVSVITQWRRLPYLDPGLPLALLPEHWAGVEAERLFAALGRHLAPGADRYVARLMA